MKEKNIVKKGRKLYYRVKICGLIRDLPLIKIAKNLRIALFNILGETELVKKIAKALIKKLPKKVDTIVAPEVKSVCLAYEVSRLSGLPYVVIRKTRKPYMLNSIGEEVLSITTGKPQMLWLDGKDKKTIKGKKVVVVDDVVSTGSTLEAVRKLMKRAGAKVIAETAVFTEGEEEKWKNIISLGNLPLFKP